MKKITVMCVLCVFLQGLLSISTEAQNLSCKVEVICFNNSQWYAVCVPPLPPGVFNCAWAGPFTESCEIPTYDCPPAPCPTCNGGEAAQPINLATGNTYVRQSDVVLPGLGGGLALIRTWNSTPVTSGYGMFGRQWSSNFEEQVFVGSDHMIKDVRGDGSLWTYGFANSWGPTGYTPIFWTAAPRNGGATMVYYGTYIDGVTSPYWTLTSKSGEQRRFTVPPNNPNSPIFQLTSITDRNGNATAVTYDMVTNRLTAVTDAASRHLYFSYGSVVVGGIAVPVVTSVTSDFGVSLTYQYDAFANLAKVIKPDNTFESFEYSPAGLLTAVKDSSGKILESHTYDLVGRGLTSSRAGNVDSVTVSY